MVDIAPLAESVEADGGVDASDATHPQDATVETLDSSELDGDASAEGGGDADAGADADADAQVCSAGTEDCDMDPSTDCNDLASDPEHCGACGHDCYGGACVSGRCKPVLMATGLPRPFEIIKDEDFIFGTGAWTDGQVWKVPLAGCATPENCASYLSIPGSNYQHIAHDQFTLYFVDKGVERLLRVDKDGKDECDLAVDQSKLSGVAVDDQYVYWSTEDDGRVWRKDKECGSGVPEPLVEGATTPYGLRLDAAGLFWNQKTGGGVHAVTLDGATKMAVWTGESPGENMWGLAVDDKWVYWRDGFHYYTYGTARVMRGRKDGSGEVQELASDEPNPRFIDVDDTHVYWTIRDAIHRMRKDGTGNVEVMADELSGSHGILVDDNVVYFCTYSGGELFRVAK